MGWFGREKTLTVEVNRVVNKVTAKQVKELLMTAQDLRNSADELEAQRDEARSAMVALEARLATANLKLKEFGNPGLF